MPFEKVPAEELTGIFKFGVPDVSDNQDHISWMESMGRSFERENMLSSWIAYNRGHPGALTDDERKSWVSGEFNPLDAVKNTEWDNPEFLPYVAKARSQRELDHYIRNFRREMENDEVLARASTGQSFVSAMAAGILDPIMAPTIMVPAIRGTLSARVAGGAATGAALAGMSETGLHQTQTRRTLSESAVNIGASAMFGALLGPLGQNTTPAERTKILKELNEELHGQPVFLADSAGSMRVDMNLPEGFIDEVQGQIKSGLITEREAAKMVRDKRMEFLTLKNEGMIKIFSPVSPVLRVATSRSSKAREILENLVEDSLIRTKNEFGHTAGPSIETMAKGNINSNLQKMHEILNSAYADYVGSTSKIGQAVHRMKHKEIMSFDEFAEAVGKAQRTGDKSEIPQVQRAAQSIRSEIDAPLEKRLIQEKMIPVDESGKVKIPMGDESYFARVYNFDRIANDRQGFKRAILDSIRARIKDPEGLEAFNNPIHLREINASLDDTISSIISSPTGFYDKNLVPETGFLKKRSLNIPSKDIEFFLVSDVRAVKESYLRNVAPQLELQSRFSSIDMVDELAAIDLEYSRMVETLPPNSRKVKSLNAEKERVKRDIMAMRDIIMNRYKRPDDPTSIWNDVGHALRAHNFVTSLGGMTVASLPDVGNTIARVGLRPFARSIKALVMSPKTLNFSREQAKRMAAGLDATLNNRAQALMMMDETINSQRKFDRFIDRSSRTFSKLTGMAYWNAGLKQFAAVSFMDDMGRLVNKGKLSKWETTKLAAAGIDNDMWRVIQSEWRTYGVLDGDLRYPNVDKWQNREAARVLSGSVLKEVDTSVVTPGAGDLPLAARGPVGKLIFQFKSFPLAATNRIFLPAMQRYGSEPVNQTMAFVTMMSLGAVSYGMKEWAAGREPSTEWNTIVREMIDKSGYFGYLPDVNAITEKVSRGQLGLQGVIGGEPISRYRARSVVNDLLGPSAGKIQDVATVLGAGVSGATGEEVTESDIRAARRLMPYQNLIYIRRVLNSIEEEIAGAVAD